MTGMTTGETVGPSADHSVQDASDKSEMRHLGWYAAELLGACSISIAQPLLSLLGANPAFFVAHRMYGWDLVFFALALTVLPAFALWLVIAAMNLVSAKLAAALQTIVLGTVVSIGIAPPIASKVPGADLLWILLLVLIAVEATILIRRFPALRSIIRLLAISPVLFIGFFLFVSPSSELIRDSYTPETSGLGTQDTPAVVWLVLDQFPLSF